MPVDVTFAYRGREFRVVEYTNGNPDNRSVTYQLQVRNHHGFVPVPESLSRDHVLRQLAFGK